MTKTEPSPPAGAESPTSAARSITAVPLDGTVLIVDDDEEMLALLTFILDRGGFTVLRATDAPGALAAIGGGTVDIVILDVMLGERNGFDVLAEIREVSQVVVVMLTALDSEEDKVRGLELGADDYITKPFHNRELVARVRAHLRRTQGLAALAARTSARAALPPASAPELVPSDDGVPPQDLAAEGILAVGPVALNLARHSATMDGAPVRLTVTEFRLLQCLMERPSTVVPTRTILEEVWGYADSSDADLVRITLFRLRRKLEPDPANPRLLHTISGVGLMLEPTAA